MNFAAIYQLFAVHTKALKTVSDEATLETTLRAIPIDIDSLKKCFAYRHVIVHRAAVLDIKGVQELGLANSDIGTALPRFSLNEIQTFVQAVDDTAHWIDTSTK